MHPIDACKEQDGDIPISPRSGSWPYEVVENHAGLLQKRLVIPLFPQNSPSFCIYSQAVMELWRENTIAGDAVNFSMLGLTMRTSRCCGHGWSLHSHMSAPLRTIFSP